MIKSKKQKKWRILSFICALAFVLSFSSKAEALEADPSALDLNADSSISMLMQADIGGEMTAVPGGRLSLYRIADIEKENSNLRYAWCPEFVGVDADFDHLNQPETNSNIEAWIKEHGIEGSTEAIDHNGRAMFQNLRPGLFFVIQTEAAENYYPINSFAVSIPQSEEGEWNYHVDASPKMEPYSESSSATTQESGETTVPLTTGSETVPVVTVPVGTTGSETSPSETPEETTSAKTPSEETETAETPGSETAATETSGSETTSLTDKTSSETTEEEGTGTETEPSEITSETKPGESTTDSASEIGTGTEPGATSAGTKPRVPETGEHIDGLSCGSHCCICCLCHAYDKAQKRASLSI